MTWGSAHGSFTLPATLLGGSYCAPPMAYSGSLPVITQITLPNGQAYRLSYESTYGLLSKIVYPSGAYVRYVWATTANQQVTTYPAGGSSVGGYCTYAYSPPVVTDRYVSPDGVNETQHQSFAYTTGLNNGAWNTKTTTVTTLDNVRGQSLKARYTYVPKGVPAQPNDDNRIAAAVPFESEIQYYDWGGATLLKTVDKDWWGINPRELKSEVVTLPIGEKSATTWSYDVNEQVTDKKEFDGDATGTLLREIVTAYATFGTTNIVDRPASVKVLDGAGCLWSSTSFAYDQQSPSSAGSVAQHATSFGTTYSTRGNLTAQSLWVGAPQASPCPTASSPGGYTLTTTHEYDTAGQRRRTVESNGASTSFDYTDAPAAGTSAPGAPTDAYLTTVANALGHAGHFTWNYATSAMATRMDPNNQVTSFQYSAPFNRLSEVDYPDGGMTTLTYSDTPGNLYTETKRKIDASRWTDAYQVFDGLGNAIAAASYNDEPGNAWDRVDTRFDAEGRVLFRSYPCAASAPTGAAQCGAGQTLTNDGLGRPTLIAEADGSTVATLYSGRATRITDEGNGTANVVRVLHADALGDLAMVCEQTGQSDAAGNSPQSCGADIAVTGFETDCAYTPMGNLKTVTAGAQQRTLVYDSVSRLLTSTNPETGPLQYVYDADSACPAPNASAGDVASRLDNRGVRACYAFDTLHRLLQTSYSDATPWAHVQYDQANGLGVSGLANTVGRVSARWTGSGQNGEVFGYDSMGRVTNNSQCTAIEPCGAAAWSIGYGYDLAGGETSAAYPSGLTLTRGYNRALRLTSIASSYSSAAFPATLLTGVRYNPRGEETSATMSVGAGAQPLAEARCYDARGRETNAAAALGSTPPACTATSGVVYALAQTPAPNGSITAVNDSVNGNWSYSYDPLNRLVASAGPSSYSFSYDRYGNRWGQTLTAGSGPAPQFSFNLSNQISYASYDAAGNLLNDGSCGYSFDGENRMAAVSACASGTQQYDAGGRRVRWTSGGTGHDDLYDLQGRLVEEFDAGPSWTRGEVYGLGRQIATYRNGTVYFNIADAQGTTRVRVDPQWNTVETCTSLPFGDALQCVSGTASPVHFTGKPRDELSQLDNFGARYYSSTQGRFLTPDWSKAPQGVPYANFANPQTLNLYSYLGNSPVSLTDPSGHYDCHGTTAECTAITKALLAIGKAMDSFKVGSERYKVLKAVIDFYGKEGEKNGVSVGFRALAPDVVGDARSPGNRVTITIDWRQAAAKLSGGPEGDSFGAELAGEVAHEGTHGIDFRSGGDHQSAPAKFVDEFHAITAQAYVAQGLNVGSLYGLWSPSWRASEAEALQLNNIFENARANAASDCVAGCN